jgi:Ras-related protein Rab-1A
MNSLSKETNKTETEENISKILPTNNYDTVQNNKIEKRGSNVSSGSMMNKSKQFDYTFKIVLIGDSGVGKSCILLRFADDQFNENFYATIGVDFRFKNLQVDGKNIRLQIVNKILF